MDKILVVTNDKGRDFTVRILESGDSYGLNNCLTWGATEHEQAWGDGVEFYDRTNMHTEYGQFVSRYYVKTMLEDVYSKYGKHGLNLDGGVSEWYIDNFTMEHVYDWLIWHCNFNDK